MTEACVLIVWTEIFNYAIVSVFTTSTRQDPVMRQPFAPVSSYLAGMPVATSGGPVLAPVHVIGTDQDDTIDGSDLADTIDGAGGNDLLYGHGGNDNLRGGAGDDRLEGGNGDDRLESGGGHDHLLGGAGNDVLEAGSGSTGILDGGDGDDELEGYGGMTYLGGAGNDRIRVYLYTAATTPTVVDGGAGDDIIDVTLHGRLAGAGTLTGGAGRDTYVLHRMLEPTLSQQAVIADFAAGPDGDLIDIRDLFNFDPGGNPFADGRLRLSASGADSVLEWRSTTDASGYFTLVTVRGVTPEQIGAANFVDHYDPRGSSSGPVLTGTAGDDRMNGTGLDDTLLGLGGSDNLFGGDGDDLLDGGDGNDELDGANGSNTLRGGNGNDILRTSSSGTNLLDGGAGADRLFAGAGNDTLVGGAGDDYFYLYGNAQAPHTVVLDGGDDNDTMRFDAMPALATIRATGGAGADLFEIAATGLDLTITDFGASDRIDLTALVPRDLSGNPFGAPGYLRAVQAGADVALYVDRDGAAGSAYAPQLSVVLANVSLAALRGAQFVNGYNPNGSSQGTVLTGTPGDDVLAGDRLDDLIDGGAGDDRLFGDAGNDILRGGDGVDMLEGGDGDDTLEGGAGNDDLRELHGNNILRGGDGNDTLYDSGAWLGAAGSLLDGGTGDDTIHAAGTAVRRVLGGSGNDQIVVSRGADPAGAPALQIDAGDGDDLLRFWGLDVSQRIEVTGGAGSDRYVFAQSFGPDGVLTIRDFQTGNGGDVLDVYSFLAYTDGNPFGTAGQARLVQDGARVLLQIDADGASAPGAFATRAVLENTTVGAFTSANFSEGSHPDGSLRGLTLGGSGGNDILAGGRLDDVLRGDGGNDTLNGNGGNDLLEGGDGHDTLDGGVGNDILRGGAGNDYLSDLLGDNLLYGGAGNDSLSSAAEGIQRLYGEAGDDVLAVTAGYGFAPTTGVDILLDGGDGNDRLEVAGSISQRSSGTVQIRGGAGNDHVSVRVNSDTLHVVAEGGAGIDTYQPLILARQGAFTVTDFATGKGGDLIDVLPLIQADGVNPFAARIQLVQRGADTILQSRLADQADGPSAFVDIMTLKNVALADLTAENFLGGIHPDGSQYATIRDGGAADDVLVGSALDDRLVGRGGDDVLTGGSGHDTLLGGLGRDTALYAGRRDEYQVSAQASGYWIVDDAGSAHHEGRDTLYAVERLHFADGAIALDIDGVAAQAYRIYRAAFDRTPDEAGLGFWMAALDAGVALRTVARDFIDSQEFSNLYGAAPDNAAIVLRLYHNILHRAPDPAGYAFWVDALERGLDDLSGVLAGFSESTENVDAVAALIGQGIAYQPWSG